jgi:hypothetical protein
MHQRVTHRAHPRAGLGNEFGVMLEPEGKRTHDEMGERVADRGFGSQRKKARLRILHTNTQRFQDAGN